MHQNRVSPHEGASTSMQKMPSQSSLARSRIGSHYETRSRAGSQALSSSSRIGERYQLDWVYLVFQDKEMEALYREYFVRKFRIYIGRVFMVTFGLSLLLTGAGIASADSDDVHVIVLCDLFGYILPILVMMFISFYAPRYFHPSAFAATFAIGVALVSILVERVLLDDVEDPILAPTLVLLLAAYGIFTRCRFIVVVLTSLLLTISYTIVLMTQHNTAILSTGDAARNCLLAACSAIVGTYVSYHYEVFLRMHFAHTHRLDGDNKQLRHQLRVLRKDFRRKRRADLDSPMEKSVLTLKRLMATAGLPPGVVSDLEGILAAVSLSSQSAHAPTLGNQIRAGELQVDSETQSWLFNEVAAREKARESVGSGRKRPSMMMRQSTTRSQFDSQTRLREIISEDMAKAPAEVLAELDSVAFDVFQVATTCPGRALTVTAMAVLARRNLFEEFEIPKNSMLEFLASVEGMYRGSNPYHNSTHAADVVQTCHVLMENEVLSTDISSLEMLALVFAAAIHDVDHPGLNNTFQVKSNSELAILYNDRSVLENHHCATGFKAALAAGVLDFLDKEARTAFRELVIELVLATDIAQHFDLLSQFKSKLSSGAFDKAVKEDRVLLLKMVIKSADISNVVKPTGIYAKWTDNVMEEFYRQGDQEREAGMDISPFCDRSTGPDGVKKCQLGFMDFVCTALFETMSEYTQDPSFVDQLALNRAKWAGQEEEADEVDDADDELPRETA